MALILCRVYIGDFRGYPCSWLKDYMMLVIVDSPDIRNTGMNVSRMLSFERLVLAHVLFVRGLFYGARLDTIMLLREI